MPPTSLNHPKSTPWKETKVNSRKMSQILEQQRIKTLCQPPQPPCTQRNEECKNIFPPFKNSWLAPSPQFLHKLHPHPPNPVSPKECIKSKCLLEYFPPLHLHMCAVNSKHGPKVVTADTADTTDMNLTTQFSDYTLVGLKIKNQHSAVWLEMLSNVLFCSIVLSCTNLCSTVENLCKYSNDIHFLTKSCHVLHTSDISISSFWNSWHQNDFTFQH